MDNTRIAIYIRLSMADEDTGRGKDESNSVVNQRSLIHRYLDNHKELSLYPRTEFVDDGFSGTNTDRPAYQKLMEQLKAGKYQVLITKDFSRANRDYLEMGELVEYLLPFLGVRYISINDGYDSNDYVGTTGGLDVVMRAIVYDAYSKDLSIKESTAKKLGQKKGRRVAGYPPYGYKKDPDNKGMDLIDPEAAAIVRRIFDMAIAGTRMSDIAKALNKDGILTPARYFRAKHPESNRFNSMSPNQVWNLVMVRDILKRYCYTGAAVGGLRKQLGPCSRHTVKQEKDDWIIVPDMHEAIVSVEEYEQAQKVIKKTGGGSKTPRDYPLRSLVCCGVCGRKMMHYKHYDRFRCRYGSTVEESLCKQVRSPKEAEMNQIVFYAIRDYMALADKKRKSARAFQSERKTAIRTDMLSLSQMQEKIEKLKKDKLKAYEKYGSDQISKADYLKQKKLIDGKISALQKEIVKASSHMSDLEEYAPEVGSELEAACEAYKSEDHLTYDMAHAFIDRIIVSADGNIEIKWRFKDIFADEQKK